MKLSPAILVALSAPAAVSAAYTVGGFDMFGRPVIVSPRVGRSVFGPRMSGRSPCVSSQGRGGCNDSRDFQQGSREADSVDRAFAELENELEQDRFRRRSGGGRGPWRSNRGRGRGRVGSPKMQIDEGTIRQQEEWVNRAFGLASDVAKGLASSEREVQEADEALRQQKEWVDRIFGFAKDVSAGGTFSAPRGEILQDDETMLQVALDIPGVSAEDIDITVEGAKEKNLIVQGKRKVGVKEQDGADRTKKFSKTISLDPSADIEKISSVLENGVLLISIPRLALEEKEKVTQKIPVNKASFDSESDKSNEPGNRPFELEIDLPGVPISNVDVQVEEGYSEKTLMVTAVREMGTESDGSPRKKKISKSYKINDLVDTNKISATLSNGVLVISAPTAEKNDTESVRQIIIRQPSKVAETPGKSTGNGEDGEELETMDDNQAADA